MCFSLIDRVRTKSWILEKVLKFAQQLSGPAKSLENKDKVLQNGKKSKIFRKLQQVLYKWHIYKRFFSFLSNLTQSYPYHCSVLWKKGCSCVLFITYLITLSLKNEMIVWKKSGKSLQFWIQKSVRTLAVLRLGRNRKPRKKSLRNPG